MVAHGGVSWSQVSKVAFESRNVRWVLYRPPCGCMAHMAHLYVKPHVSTQTSLPELKFERVDSFGTKVVYGGL